MLWNLKDWGESFEKKYGQYIIQKFGLKGYEIFWCKFIGNVDNKPASLENSDNDLDKTRKLLGQWNYSILRNLYNIDNINETLKKHTFKNNNLKIRLRYDREFLMVTHLMYNNLEILNKIYLTITKKENKKYTDLERNFVLMRNLISHNIKPLVKISSNYEVPENLEWFNGVDDKEIIWSDESFFSGLKHHPLKKYYEWCLQNTVSYFKNILTEEYSYMDTEFKNKKNKIVDVSQNIVLNRNDKHISTSGETFVAFS
ncbi:MAG: hypothetical protein WCJ03_09065 [Bacteroidales bacterium]